MSSAVATVEEKVLVPAAQSEKPKRLASIDLLRGIVMIIMALDHVRDYFHNGAFLFNPEDLSQTNVPLFFTRWITHYCAPVFVLLAGVSANLYGAPKSRKELSFFLLTRGLWLVLVELFIVSLFRTFNPYYTYQSLQVIWAIGISMIVLSAMIHANWYIILVTGIVLVAGHNLLDNIHLHNFFWALLHEKGYFTFGDLLVHVHYPLLPWIGLMLLGYCLGNVYARGYAPERRKMMLLVIGLGAVALFILLRLGNLYGDPSDWSVQKNPVFSMLSFLNVTKYPPSLLYVLMTIGPGLIFLAFAERPLNAWTARIAVFGRVPMFYYLAHILLIHVLACIGVVIQGHPLGDMVLNSSVQSKPALKGYGFDLPVVYGIWVLVLLILYPLCKWFDNYKRTHQSTRRWLSYL